MKKILSLISVLLASLIILTGCSFDRTGKEEDSLPFETPTFEAGTILEMNSFEEIKTNVISYAIFDTATTGIYIENSCVQNKLDGTNYETLAVVDSLKSKYSEQSGELHLSRGFTELGYIQFIKNDAGDPCFVKSLIYYSKEPGLYTTFTAYSKDGNLELKFSKNGKVTFTQGKNSSVWKYTNNGGCITITDNYGSSIDFYYYENGMLFAKEGLAPMKKTNEVKLATSINYSTKTKLNSEYKKNYFKEALSILPKNIKKTFVICSHTGAELDSDVIEDKISDLLTGTYSDRTNIYISLDELYGNIKYPATSSNNAFGGFEGVTNLKGITLINPSNNADYKIAEDAFKGCSALEDVFISSKCSEIGVNAFKDSNLTNLKFENPTKWTGVTAASLKAGNDQAISRQ